MTSPDWFSVHIRKVNSFGGNRGTLGGFPIAGETLRVWSGHPDFLLGGSLHQHYWCSGVASDCCLPYIPRNAEFSKESRSKYVQIFHLRHWPVSYARQTQVLQGIVVQVIMKYWVIASVLSSSPSLLMIQPIPQGFKPISVSKSR